MSKHLQNKIITAAVPQSQMPENIKEYACSLIIEQDIETQMTKKYLQFRHKQGKAQPFKIILSKLKNPSTLMHVYKMENEKLILKGKVDRVAESRVEKQIKEFKVQEVDIDDEDEYIERKLVFEKESSENDSDDSDQDSESSSAGMAPTTEEFKAKIKTAIIQILNKRERLSSIKEINSILKKQYKFKIPENSAKQIVMKVCVADKKSKGYTLKSQYVDVEERMQGKKKMKYNQGF